MPTATFNGVVLARSDATEVVEGNHYFPPDSVNWDYFSKTEHSTHCPWKGDASYYTVSAAGETKENVAWQYEDPFEKATHITEYVAFYPAVTVG
ncbi:MAG: DUF427 domain-containing protein [Acidimicrobiales bacterium]|nr:DUF427 domain-containing protein [Acidimicrobiales bacterium]